MPPAFDFLEAARGLGLLGPAPLDLHRRHSLAFADALAEARSRGADDRNFADARVELGQGLRILDLGSGAGLPGLVLAERWPDAFIDLLEGSDRRCRLLEQWVSEAGWGSRVTVLRGRAEELGRRDDLRGTFDAVVARLFGPPAVTAECASPFLKLGGYLVVSDPPGEPVGKGPESPDPPSNGSTGPRWPADGLALLGLEQAEVIKRPFHFTILVQVKECPVRYPRRTGIPAKRPLF
ncbi:MAG: RsmG family class I SAM-dependent methyltransferase [Acidimicrobiales bacterium]